MGNVQRAHSATRRRAILFIVAVSVLGSALIVIANRYSEPLREWILSDPVQAPRRLKLLFAAFAVAGSAPLLLFAAYLWKLGSKVVRSRQFPPPGQPVVRDVEVVEGQRAIARGRALQTFSAILGLFCVAFWILLWRLAAFIRTG